MLVGLRSRLNARRSSAEGRASLIGPSFRASAIQPIHAVPATGGYSQALAARASCGAAGHARSSRHSAALGSDCAFDATTRLPHHLPPSPSPAILRGARDPREGGHSDAWPHRRCRHSSCTTNRSSCATNPGISERSSIPPVLRAPFAGPLIKPAPLPPPTFEHTVQRGTPVPSTPAASQRAQPPRSSRVFNV